MNLTGNADSARAVLKRVQEQMATKAVRAAVRAAAEVVKAEMVQQAPVLDHKTANSTSLEPGDLKADIGIRMSTTSNGEVVTARIGPSEKTAHVGAWVEHGHRLVKGGASKVLANGKTQGPGREVGEVASHPWARPAFENSQAQATDAFTKEIQEQLKKVVR